MNGNMRFVRQPRYATDPSSNTTDQSNAPSQPLSITVKVSVGAGGLATTLGQ